MNNSCWLAGYYKPYQKEIFKSDIQQPTVLLHDIILDADIDCNKVILVGNGASAAIASHCAVDFMKQAGIRAITFNEPSLLTCFANDYGYEKWVTKAIDYYADPGDVVILISSSGESKNIINGAKHAKARGCKVATFSGFSPRNSLRKIGDVNFWVNSDIYNIVECTHMIWLTSVIDLITARNDDILSLKNKHAGERCFVLGTGPSLNKTNFDLIKNETLFGVNTFFNGVEKFNVNCKYFAVSDKIVWNTYYKQIEALNTTLFVRGKLIRNRPLKHPENAYVLRLNTKQPMWKSHKFSTNLVKGTFWGDTVVIDMCLQIAHYLGFSKVYLLGCDCDYSGWHRFNTPTSENKTSFAIRGDFSRIFESYRICKKAYEDGGREIINATVGGNLEVFKREKLEDIMAG